MIETKNKLDPLDVVVVNDTAYSVRQRHGFPCTAVCHFYDHQIERCCGYCYRWDNADDIVFIKLMPAEMLAADAHVCTTTTWDGYEEVMRQKEYLRKKARKMKEGDKPKKPGPKVGSHHKTKPSTGCVSKNRGSYHEREEERE